MKPIVGHCLCGAIGVSCNVAAPALVFCHCSQCRKTAGAPYLAVFPAPVGAVSISDPSQRLREFRATRDKVRAFCGVCGAPVFSRRDGADILRLRAGLFDELEGAVPQAHIHMAAPASWYQHRGALPQYAGIEPNRT